MLWKATEKRSWMWHQLFLEYKKYCYLYQLSPWLDSLSCTVHGYIRISRHDQDMSAFGVPKGPGQVESRVKHRIWTLSVWSAQKESLDTNHTSCNTKGSHNKQSLPFFITLFSTVNQLLLSTPEYILSVARNVKYFCGKQNYPGLFYFPTHQH